MTLVTKFLFRGHAIGKWTQGPQEPTGREAQRAPGARGERRRIPARCKMGLEGIVSKRLGSRYRSGKSPDWLKFKNPAAPAVKREAEEDWGK